MSFKENISDSYHNQRKQEHKNRNTVDAMHVFDPSCMRRFWVALFDVEIFRYLLPNSH